MGEAVVKESGWLLSCDQFLRKSGFHGKYCCEQCHAPALKEFHEAHQMMFTREAGFKVYVCCKVLGVLDLYDPTSTKRSGQDQ